MLLEPVPQLELTSDAFTDAINALYNCWCQNTQGGEWQDVSIKPIEFGGSMLRITKKLLQEAPNSSRGLPEIMEPETTEDDEEALHRAPAISSRTTVIYDIIYSTTYRVPLLYITLKHSLAQPVLSLEEVYDALVPSLQRHQLQSVGPVGSLSMTEHPVTGMPVYLIHPCRTQEAMAAVAGERGSTLVQYLMLWLGLVGPSVGLSVPFELAEMVVKQEGF
ncbi:hypothetical protein LTR62_005545 [Meristemomyces frigidus]|uniref:Ubiquitin-like-conjugating enzyme ATG10 n=1 Tax=Meristemomyces frigidus TaxID=1508187 RepID=A0AAN7YFB0_9PEZI|nr:hypothetical protein LTR62_005545 [Meristemomyces frigidus]